MPARSSMLRLASTAAVLSLALVSCAGTETSTYPAEPTATEQQSTDTPNNHAALAKYYDQKVQWVPCDNDIECATIRVPLDYASPEEQEIELALNRRVTKGATRNLLLNPGGPGMSGLEMLTESAPYIFSDKVTDVFNTVGFDPRGVGKSSPVQCETDEEKDQSRQENLRAWVPADRDEIIAQSKAYAQDCVENTGPLLGHVDTVSAAKDLDIIRAVLGNKKLDYLGFSYGTYLGATYADLFPQRVGSFVLDGAMDPTVTTAELDKAQAVAFEGEIDAWLQNCLDAAQCPFDGTLEEAKVQLQLFFTQIENEPLVASDGRTVPIIDFVNGFIIPLYDNSRWPMLTAAMTEAMSGNVDQILLFADLSNGRDQNGVYESNANEAFVAINCLDRPVDSSPEAMQSQAEELMRVAPTLGKYFSYYALTCKDWQYPPTATEQKRVAKGSDKILVVGTTEDPATPYQWSQSLTEQLDNATLLTYQGHGHTAYGRSNDCIDQAVEDYLVDGKAPKNGTQC